MGLVLGSLSPGIALAHGEEITIEVSALNLDPQQPRTRLYRAAATYSGDKEPVSEAVIELVGQRQQTGEMLRPVRLLPLNAAGYYAAQVTFPHYGNWEIKVQAREPGSGEASFVDEIPGIDQRNAEEIIAEIGTDMSHFATANHVASWAGLCPGNNQSGGKRRTGKTRKGNRWLCSTLVQAARGAARSREGITCQHNIVGW